MARLTDERVSEVLAGVIRLVIERGSDRLTLDEVATETHTGKATLYRQWGSKVGLVIAALNDGLEEIRPEALPDTGTLRSDILTLICSPERAKDPLLMDYIGAILPALRHDADLAAAFRAGLTDRAVGAVDILVERAVQRGEVNGEAPALEYMAILLFAPIVIEDIFFGVEMTTEFLANYLDTVVLPLIRTA